MIATGYTGYYVCVGLTNKTVTTDQGARIDIILFVTWAAKFLGGLCSSRRLESAGGRSISIPFTPRSTRYYYEVVCIYVCNNAVHLLV